MKFSPSFMEMKCLLFVFIVSFFSVDLTLRSSSIFVAEIVVSVVSWDDDLSYMLVFKFN